MSVKTLFSCLVEKAHSHTFQSDRRWIDCLEEKYHTFAGNYHALQCKNPHRFEFNKVEEPYVFLMLTPPSHLQSPVFFNAEGYAKHLIGMVSRPGLPFSLSIFAASYVLVFMHIGILSSSTGGPS